MSPDEAALCESAHRSRAAANVATRSAVEAAVDDAVKEASEFVAENAVEYRRLKVRFAKVRQRRGSDMQCNTSRASRLNQRNLKGVVLKPFRRADIPASRFSGPRPSS